MISAHLEYGENSEGGVKPKNIKLVIVDSH